MHEERERFFSRLATIPGIRTMPSIGSWILCRVDQPADLARKVNRRLDPGTISVPRHVPGAVRVPVRDPKKNEELYRTIRELLVRKARHEYFEELKTAPRGACEPMASSPVRPAEPTAREASEPLEAREPLKVEVST